LVLKLSTTPVIGASPLPMARNVNRAMVISAPVAVLSTLVPTINTSLGGSLSVHENDPDHPLCTTHDPLSAVTSESSRLRRIWKLISVSPTDRTRTCTSCVVPTGMGGNCSPVVLPRSRSPLVAESKLQKMSVVV
jgi:hypothetical protein